MDKVVASIKGLIVDGERFLLSDKIDLTGNPADEQIIEFRWIRKTDCLTKNFALNKNLKQLVSQVL